MNRWWRFERNRRRVLSGLISAAVTVFLPGVDRVQMESSKRVKML